MAESEVSRSNLDRFLHCTTPLVPSRILPKSEMRKLNRVWHPWERENVEFFTLGDLWNCFDEWSFYGVGVPLSLTNSGAQNPNETLLHYYVPYLSALQIFTSTPSPHCFREDTDSGDGEARDSYSESYSDESDSGKPSSSRWDGFSSEEGGSEHDVPWQLDSRLGYLYCEYFERATPYVRLPLKDKISSLARRYPGLMSLRSVDLSPASWMAVSWYPIYPIPMGRASKDLSTCFLNYHTLSSCFQDMDVEDDVDGAGVRPKRKQGEGLIPLEPFGLATHKMQGDLWASGRGGRDNKRLASFLGVADSWLKQMKVQHHDFNFFTGVRRG